MEDSPQPVKPTLAELRLPHTTFYRWCARHLEAGYYGLHGHTSQPRQL